MIVRTPAQLGMFYSDSDKFSNSQVITLVGHILAKIIALLSLSISTVYYNLVIASRELYF